jgi:hypothetical protein
MLRADLGGVFHLGRVASRNLRESTSHHGTSDPHFFLTAQARP